MNEEETAQDAAGPQEDPPREHGEQGTLGARSGLSTASTEQRVTAVARGDTQARVLLCCLTWGTRSGYLTGTSTPDLGRRPVRNGRTWRPQARMTLGPELRIMTN